MPKTTIVINDASRKKLKAATKSKVNPPLGVYTLRRRGGQRASFHNEAGDYAIKLTYSTLKSVFNLDIEPDSAKKVKAAPKSGPTFTVTAEQSKRFKMKAGTYHFDRRGAKRASFTHTDGESSWRMPYDMLKEVWNLELEQPAPRTGTKFHKTQSMRDFGTDLRAPKNGLTWVQVEKMDSVVLNDVMHLFKRLAGELEPENLYCDGEVSHSVAMRTKNKIEHDWALLEKKVGNAVSVDQVWDEIINEARSSAS